MKPFGSLTAAALVVTLGAGAPAWAGAPTDQIREYTDHVIKILEDPALKDESRGSERREAVRTRVVAIFDVNETARRALGRHWQARTPVERAEFVRLFADLLEQTYISKIDLYGGERLRFLNESVDGDRAVVRAQVVTRRGTEVPVEARMLFRGERWLIYDVAIENISLIGSYRQQFDRIIRTQSYDELIRRLRSKQEEFVHDKPGKPGGDS